jgi:hypothetical protein
MSIYRHPEQAPRGRAKHSREDLAVYIALLLFGALPFVWLFATGEANQLDLGVATLILIAATTAIFHNRRKRKDSP